MLLPALTVAGPVLVVARSAETVGVVLIVAELLVPIGSVVVLEALAVLLIVVPVAVLESTFATMVKVAVAPTARVGVVANTVPLDPTGGPLTDQPAGPVAET